MKINTLATRDKFKSALVKIATWAKANGHDPEMTRRLIGNQHPIPKDQETTKAGKIIKDLKRDGFLVVFRGN